MNFQVQFKDVGDPVALVTELRSRWWRISVPVTNNSAFYELFLDFKIVNFQEFGRSKVEQTYMLDLKTAEQLFYILYQGRSLPPSKAKNSTD